MLKSRSHAILKLTKSLGSSLPPELAAIPLCIQAQEALHTNPTAFYEKIDRLNLLTTMMVTKET